jgi:hypothetical protein
MRKNSGLFGLVALVFLATSFAGAASPTDRLPTQLSPAEEAREVLDAKQYPNFMSFLKSVESSDRLFPTDSRNAKFIPTAVYFDPTPEVWHQFFKAAAKDKMTCLRAFGLLAREIKKRGYVIWGSSAAFKKAVADLNVDMGLALPAKNLGAAVWSPDPSVKDPDFQVHLKIFYTEPYTHQFPDEILPANLKIGFGDEMSYWHDGKQFKQHTIDADLYYGEKSGVGFRNVKGIGGQKRGFLGFMQKVLFFLPDAINSMTIQEKKNAMVTEALVNTTVDGFETDPKFSIKIQ